MTFVYGNYLVGIIVFWIVLALFVFRGESRFFNFVNTYWFLKRRWRHFIGTGLWLFAVLGLLLSLMDWRGPEERIKTQVSEDKTIILIDTSASMLAEDVKPSRLQKGVMLAKHFIRRAPGQQMSVVAFAEVQRKIVPFTTDIDLLDARLDSLKNLRNQNGSSALTIALQESIQYFKESGDDSGNIIIITDGEETAGGIDLKIPKDIRVALVGVGTTNGGRIPLDDSRGFRLGYKKFKGQDITTKLNPKYFETLQKSIPVSKTWILGSYSLPSDEIASFFKTEKSKSQKQQDMVVRPVKMELIVIPSLLLFILGLIFRSMTPYRLSSLIVVFLFSSQVFGQNPEKPKKELSPEILNKLGQLESGKLNAGERLKLADDLQKEGETEHSISLYQESLESGENVPVESIFNYGTALLKKGDISQGLSVYQKIKDSLPKNELDSYLEKMAQNTVHALNKKKQQEEQKKQKQKEDKNKKEDDSDKKGEGQSGSNDKENQEKKKDGKSDKDDKNQDKKDKDKDKDSEKNPEDNKDEKDSEKENKPKEEQKNMPPKKVSPLLKQLMSDDRQLQMKMIENGTRDLNKRHSRENKDW